MSLKDLNKDLATKQLVGFWASNITDTEGSIIEPRSTVVPYLWKWHDIYNGLLEAGELVSLEQSERRTIRLVNPGVPGTTGATNTVHTSVQLVKPGEIAKAHRHTLTALRFVVQGGGAFTTVEGERFSMYPGDLILTPQWTWHDHYNGTGENIIWVDGHDGPLLKALEVMAIEPFSKKQQPVEAMPDFSLHQFGWARPPEQLSEFPDPPFRYPWETTYNSLEALASSPGDECDGVLLRYVNPRTGGFTLRTIGCEIQMIRPGEKTRSHRHTSTTIYHVFRGNGATVIEDKRVEWGKGDFFTIPLWSWHQHENDNKDEAILFSINDRPVKETFGLYQEERR